MALPNTYSELYPGRFLKADLLQGKKVTLTIKNVDVEELIGENNKPAAKVIVAFTERPLELVLPKTNGECLKRMFGNVPKLWIGKRITLFPSKTECMGQIVDCIRIWGSPDIDEDIDITVPQGRKKALQMTMHRVAKAVNGNAPKPPAGTPDLRLKAAFEVLGWNDQEQAAFLVSNTHLAPAELLAELNRTIDERNQLEA